MVKGSLTRAMNASARWGPCILILFFLLSPRFADALDASLLAGTADSVNTDETSNVWQLDFRRNFESPFAVSVAWINEGHFREHRRDGLAGQLWGRIPLVRDKVSIAFGAGPYRYFDTKTRPDGRHENAHGWAPVFSLSAVYFMDNPWFIRLSANRIHVESEIDTNAFLLGLGYRLQRGPAEKTSGTGTSPGCGESPLRETGGELMPFLGITIHNSLESGVGMSGGIEYRRGLSRNFDWTLTWINEDNRKEIRRTGIGSQVWLVDSFLCRRIVLGLGAGLFTFYDRKPPHEVHSPIDVAGLVTLSAGYRFSERWIGRMNWSRVMTANDRDSDIISVGAGYLWNE